MPPERAHLPGRILLIFLDGVGIGSPGADVNPFQAAQLPTFQRLAGGRFPTLEVPTAAGPHGRSFPLDAGLGVPGLPQSGTGQTALLTGLDSGRIFGGHFGPWVPVRLRARVEEESVLRRLTASGRRVAFANAYPRGWPGPRGSRGIAGPPLAARGAGLLTRHDEALALGDAVASEIVNDGWREALGYRAVPRIVAREAGRNLARIAGDHDFTLFAHYTTDAAGHRRSLTEAVAALERVDRFLEGVADGLGSDTLLLVASDHGNIEDVRAGHTANPALGLAAGPGAEQAAEMRDLRDVTPFILGIMGEEAVDRPGEPG